MREKMSNSFRPLKPGEEEEVLEILKPEFRLANVSHLRWRFMDSPFWDYDYSVVGEADGRIVAAAFLEPQPMKMLDGTIDILLFGAGVVRPAYRRRGYYRGMIKWSINKSFQMRKTLVTACIVSNLFFYPALKKDGFFPLEFQHRYIRVLNMKETLLATIEMAKMIKIPEKILLKVRIVSKSEEPFVLRLQNGKVSVEEDGPEYDGELSGDVERVIPLLIDRDFKGVAALFLKRRVKIGVRLSFLRKIVRLTKMLVIS